MAQDGWVALGELLSGKTKRDALAAGRRAAKQEISDQRFFSRRTQTALDNARQSRDGTAVSDNAADEHQSLGDLIAGDGNWQERIADAAEISRGNAGNIDGLTGGMNNLETPLADALIGESPTPAQLRQRQHPNVAANPAERATNAFNEHFGPSLGDLVGNIAVDRSRQKLKQVFGEAALSPKEPVFEVERPVVNATLPRAAMEQLPKLQMDSKWRENLEAQAQAAIAAGADPAAVTARMKQITAEMASRFNQASRPAGTQPVRKP